MLLTEIDHIAIAVRDLDAAIDYYRRAFGAEVSHREIVESDAIIVEVDFGRRRAKRDASQSAAAETHIGRRAIPARRFEDIDRFVDLYRKKRSAIRQIVTFLERDIAGVDVVRLCFDAALSDREANAADI